MQESVIRHYCSECELSYNWSPFEDSLFTISRYLSSAELTWTDMQGRHNYERITKKTPPREMVLRGRSVIIKI